MCCSECEIARNETKNLSVLYEQLQEGRDEEAEQVNVVLSLVIKLERECEKKI